MALDRAFYNRPTLEVARDLLGALLVCESAAGRAAGLIVEVEAYIGESDPACHAAAGRTRRTAPLYGPPGHAYVYLNYGVHYLLNAVTEDVDRPAAVLIRALQPVDGLELMRRRRTRGTGRRPGELDESALCRGPGNLTRALGVSLRNNRQDLCAGRLVIEPAAAAPGRIAWSPRIGISVGTEAAWRCYIEGHPAASSRNAFTPRRSAAERVPDSPPAP